MEERRPQLSVGLLLHEPAQVVFAIDEDVRRLATLEELEQQLGRQEPFPVFDDGGEAHEVSVEKLREIVVWAERRLLVRGTPPGKRTRLSSLGS